MDDFATTANTKENLIPQIKNGNKSLKLEWKPADGLERLTKLIRDFRLEQTGKVLLIEGIFLCHEKVLRNELDKIIYLDTNKEEADKRRVKREKERWGEKYFPEDHPDSFARLFKIAFNRYEELYEPKRNADLVVSLTD
jgi:uridine kinase